MSCDPQRWPHKTRFLQIRQSATQPPSRCWALLTTVSSKLSDLLAGVYLLIQEIPVHLQPSCSHIISARNLDFTAFLPCLKANLVVVDTFRRGSRGHEKLLRRRNTTKAMCRDSISGLRMSIAHQEGYHRRILTCNGKIALFFPLLEFMEACNAKTFVLRFTWKKNEL